VPTLTATDSLLLLLYLFFILAVGISLKSLISSSEEFFQGGRALPAWLCGLAMVTASLSSQEFLGISAAGVRYGFASIPFYLLGAVPAALFAGLFLVPIYYRSKARTIPEFLALRFDHKTRVLNACLFAAMAVFSAGVSLYAMARVFAALHVFEEPLRATGLGPQATLMVTMGVPAALVLAYVLLGGLTATIYNLTIQFFVMVAGLLPVVFLGLKQIGGWSGLKSAAASAAFVQQGHAGIPRFALAAAVGLIFGAGTWCADFRVLQAPMVARDADAARMAPIIAAAARTVMPFLLILPAIVALAMPTPRTTIVIHNENGTIYHDITVVPPEEEAGQGLAPARLGAATGKPLKDADGRTVLDGELAAPNLLAHFLPTGLLGLGIAALLAAMMSGAATSLTAFGTVFTCDLYEPIARKNPGGAKSIVVARCAMAGAMLLAFGVACAAMRFNSLLDGMVLLFAVVNMPLLAALLLGAFWKRTTAAGAFSGLIAGAAAALVHHGLALPRGQQRGIHGGWIAVLHHPSSELQFAVGTAAIAFIFSLAVAAAVSAFIAPRAETEAVGLIRLSSPAVKIGVARWGRPETLAIAILLAAVVACVVFV
jgi:solute:Na+ symporter, SSS family